MRLTLLALLLLARPALADVKSVVEEQILPSFATLADTTAALNAEATMDCRAEALAPAYNAAFDAWMAVADLHIGPSETGALSMAYWPDARGATPKTLKRLIATQDDIARNPVSYADVSIAARGFFALDMVMFDPAFSDYTTQDFTCTLVRAITGDIALQAAYLNTEWSEHFAPVLLSAGQPGNARYLSKDEAVRALYTQLYAGLDFTFDSRLGLPMGTFDRPRPKLAEAWRSDRSLRNVLLSVEAAQKLAHGLAGSHLPLTDAAAARVKTAAEAISDPSFQDIDDAQARFRVEILQQVVMAMRDAVSTEVGQALGISAGFNAQDGD